MSYTLPLACIIFEEDLISQKVIKKLKNTKTILIKHRKDEEIDRVFNQFEYVAMVHSGLKIDNRFVMDLVWKSIKTNTKIGFIVHPNLEKLNLAVLNQLSTNSRHAILNHCKSVNLQIDEDNFWYGSGKHASITNLFEWVNRGEVPSVVSLLSHSREDLIYAVDGMLCSKGQKIETNNPIPCCYATGYCYRKDLPSFDISKLKANLIILNGCTNFKIGADVYHPETTLIGKMLEGGVKHIIGSPLIKVGYIEELYFIHSQMGEKSLGEIVHHLNKTYLGSAIGEPPFALWGDPRTILSKLTHENNVGQGLIGGEKFVDLVMKNKKYNTPNFSIKDDIHEIHLAYKAYLEYTKWPFLGLTTNFVSGALSQLENLIKGTNKMISESSLVQNGKTHYKLHEKIEKISKAEKTIEKQLIDYLVDRTYNKGFDLTDCYREGFILADVQKACCPGCKEESSLYRLESPYDMVRLVNNCPRCGIPEDYPVNNKQKPLFNIRTEKNKIHVEFEKFEGEIGVCVVSGKKFNFDKFSKKEKNGKCIYSILVEDVKPHRYQLKIFNINQGTVSSYQRIMHIQKHFDSVVVNFKEFENVEIF